MNIIYRILRVAVVFFFSSTVLVALIYRWAPVPLTPLMVIRCVEHVSHAERPRLKHQWVPLCEMSRSMPVAVIASEDQNFMSHNGFDVNAIKMAIEEREAGKRVRGGSTISQQTAKNVFLWPASTWVRKGFEVYFTFLIETLWPKERIMEVYLNSIEMGDGIYGAEAVAMTNFGCHAYELSRSNCALIAATLPNPRKFSSFHPSPYMRKRQAWIERQMLSVQPFNMTSDDKASKQLEEEEKASKKTGKRKHRHHRH